MAGDEVDEQTRLFRRYHYARAMRDQWEDEYKEAEKSLIDYLKGRNRKSGKADGLKFTLVKRERSVINESGLKKSLGARLWKSVTVQKLDRSKLEAAMESGLVDPVLVVQNSTVVEDKAYLRTSGYVEEE